jgi:putative oxygen-independent coproporphyrinogen III oxidase
MRQLAGVYIHFPYCLAKCPYCDFASYGVERQAIDHAGYADAVLRELDARAPQLEGRSIESVFFGGGTPSLWEPRELGRVLAGVQARLRCSEALEVTVECNPTSLDEERARALVGAGVNRLSIGVQSLDDTRLRFLGRLHDAAGAREAVHGAMRAAVPRVSADLIFGLPGQTTDQARDEALELADLGLSHMSCYQLTIEPGTRFGELAKRGRLPLADDGAVAESFVAIDEALGSRGLRHYEISNYARPGQEARHNLGYWRGDEYLGLGCAAYGFVLTRGDHGVRYRNDPIPERYVSGARNTEEVIDADTHARERIMLGLRVAEGLDLSELGEAWTPARARAAEWLEHRGRVAREGARLRIPASAWLWADDTAARLF